MNSKKRKEYLKKDSKKARVMAPKRLSQYREKVVAFLESQPWVHKVSLWIISSILLSLLFSGDLPSSGEVTTLEYEGAESYISLHPFLSFVGRTMLIMTSLLLVYVFSTKNIKKASLNIKDLYFLSSLLVFMCLLMKVTFVVSSLLVERIGFFPLSAYHYAIPMAAGAILVRLLLNSEIALGFSILIGILSGLLLDNSLFFAIYFFIGSLIGAHKVWRTQQRLALIKAGLFVGIANLLMVGFYTLILSRGGGITPGDIPSLNTPAQNPPLLLGIALNIMFAFGGGIVASILVTGILPILEIIFGYTTDITLLELANMDHPLLRDMIIRAPGTYHHSILVGSLAEAASEVIHVNPVLARVGSYYHDIGKMKIPHYFIENVRGSRRTEHDKIKSSLSALVIISHVKDGVELARQYRLPGGIIDCINQHHGTSIIKFFYEKAKKTANKDAGDNQDLIDQKYRYPGPKPQTKEAGIIMLADAVEASVRVLNEPTPARIKGLVHKTINDIFNDGQLDGCELTLKDLHHIAESFTRSLSGVYHQRIDYVHTRGRRKERHRDGDIHSNQAQETGPESRRPQGNNGRDPKKIRL